VHLPSTIYIYTYTLGGGVWSASHSRCFIPRERDSSTYCIGCWMGPRTCLNAVAKRKIFFHCPCRESNTGRPARSLSLHWLSYPSTRCYVSYDYKYTWANLWNILFWISWPLFKHRDNFAFTFNLFSNSLNLSSSLNVRKRVTQVQRTSETVVSYISVFVFL
jgi:hypothetical protein